jgi:hypothetical protein
MTAPSALPLRPHPRNISNRDVEAKENAVVKRCKDEDRQWSSVISRANRKQQQLMARLREKHDEPDISDAPGWMQQAFAVAERFIAEGEGDLSAMGEFEDVEYKVSDFLAAPFKMTVLIKILGGHIVAIVPFCTPVLDTSSAIPRWHLLLFDL